jgi:hypothetical protein
MRVYTEKLAGRRIALLLVFLCRAATGTALDFGLIVNQSGEYTNTGGDSSEKDANYTGGYSPWLSAELGNDAQLYLSAKLGMDYEAKEWKYDSPRILPEAERSGISWRPDPSFYLEAGRLRFQDPLGIIASGLFDGFQASTGAADAGLSAGAFYTGFLYKETAEIVMSPHDALNYALPLDYSDFDTYFASRRILVSVGAEFSDFLPPAALTLNGIAQFDVNEGGGTVHSQYFTVKYTASPASGFMITGGGVAGFKEIQDEDTLIQFAAVFGLDWEAPGNPRDMVQAEIRWSSGEVNKNIGAFAPVNSIAQGQVFTPALSALMTIRAKYTARLAAGFSASAEGTCFIRTDGQTLADKDYPPSGSRLLGAEFYGSCIWAPASDFMLTAGIGAFFPSLGNVFEEDARILWLAAAGIILSL